MPATLAPRVRVPGRGKSDKNDPNDARSLTAAALRSPGLRSVRQPITPTRCASWLPGIRASTIVDALGRFCRPRPPKGRPNGPVGYLAATVVPRRNSDQGWPKSRSGKGVFGSAVRSHSAARSDVASSIRLFVAWPVAGLLQKCGSGCCGVVRRRPEQPHDDAPGFQDDPGVFARADISDWT